MTLNPQTYESIILTSAITYSLIHYYLISDKTAAILIYSGIAQSAPKISSLF